MTSIRTTRNLAAVIRGRRLRLGWTQADLANRARVSRTWLVDVEAAKRPNAEFSRVLRVLEALNIRLTTDDDDPHDTPSRSIDLDAHLDQFRP